eukprot:2252539-Amphidinium_carterae.1
MKRSYLFLEVDAFVEKYKCKPQSLDLAVVEMADPEGHMLKGVVVVNPERPHHELSVVRHGCMVLTKHLLEPAAQLRPRQGEDLSK